KMKAPDQGVRMNLNESLPRREAPSPLSPDDSRSFKLTSPGQLIASGGGKTRFPPLTAALGASAIIDYDAKYRSAIAQLVTTGTHLVSRMSCEGVLPTIMSAALARATVVSSRPSHEQATPSPSTSTNRSPFL
ncbi:hypothetical protein FOZ62_028563, partial [Perkinsus olseni]